MVQLLGSVFTNSTGGEIEAIIIALVVATIIAIIIGFVVNVYYSSAYRQYLIDKKNQEIIEKNKQLSQNKVYTKGDSKDSTIKNIFISDHREEDAAYIDHSEQ